MNTFYAVDQTKKELQRAPLPRNAAMPQRSFFQQFYLSYSLRFLLFKKMSGRFFRCSSGSNSSKICVVQIVKNHKALANVEVTCRSNCSDL